MVMTDAELAMEPTALTIRANDYCSQNFLDFSFFLLVDRVLKSVFADDAALFYITCTVLSLLLLS